MAGYAPVAHACAATRTVYPNRFGPRGKSAWSRTRPTCAATCTEHLQQPQSRLTGWRVPHRSKPARSPRALGRSLGASLPPRGREPRRSRSLLGSLLGSKPPGPGSGATRPTISPSSYECTCCSTGRSALLARARLAARPLGEPGVLVGLLRVPSAPGKRGDPERLRRRRREAGVSSAPSESESAPRGGEPDDSAKALRLGSWARSGLPFPGDASPPLPDRVAAAACAAGEFLGRRRRCESASDDASSLELLLVELLELLELDELEDEEEEEDELLSLEGVPRSGVPPVPPLELTGGRTGGDGASGNPTGSGLSPPAPPVSTATPARSGGAAEPPCTAPASAGAAPAAAADPSAASGDLTGGASSSSAWAACTRPASPGSMSSKAALVDAASGATTGAATSPSNGVAGTGCGAAAAARASDALATAGTALFGSAEQSRVSCGSHALNVGNRRNGSRATCCEIGFGLVSATELTPASPAASPPPLNSVQPAAAALSATASAVGSAAATDGGIADALAGAAALPCAADRPAPCGLGGAVAIGPGCLLEGPHASASTARSSRLAGSGGTSRLPGTPSTPWFLTSRSARTGHGLRTTVMLLAHLSGSCAHYNPLACPPGAGISPAALPARPQNVI